MYPGFVRDRDEDVRSFDGRRITVPRSSRLIRRLPVRHHKAEGVLCDLDAADPARCASVSLARLRSGWAGATTGIQGEVKSDFFQRFGSALLSVVGGLSTIASSGATVVLGGGQSAAASAADRDGRSGRRCGSARANRSIFTARDLDATRK